VNDANIDVTIRRMSLRLAGAAPADRDIATALQRIVSVVQANIVGNIRRNQHKPSRFPSGAKQNLVDYGRLLNSIKTEVGTVSGGKGRAYVSSVGVPYAAIHEFGGRIRSKKAFGLAVPFAPWAKDRTLRQVGKHIIVRKQNPTGKFLGYAFVKDRHTNKKVSPFRDGSVSHLILKFVDIPARPFFFPGVRSSTSAIVDILRNLRRDKNGSQG
jgi:phage gpG-like protein